MADSSASLRSGPTAPARPCRRLPIGVELVDDRRAHARVWAPRAGGVEVVLDSGGATALEPNGDGYFAGTFEAAAGDRYRFRLGHDGKLYPDPASRFQPDGPHGSSAIVDPQAFRWTDHALMHRELAPGSAFLQKPFTPEVFARKVRHVLDSTASPAELPRS